MEFLKYLLIGVLALLISNIAIAVDPPAEHPKTGEPLVIDCLKGTPKIDGKLNDWMLNFLTPAVLDTKEQIFPGAAQGAASWKNPADSSGEFYLLWDDDNIYVASVMKDDKLSMKKAAGSIWNADCIEIFFSTTNAVPPHAEHYQYGWNANNQIWNWCNMDGAGSREPDYLKIESVKTGDGYICEVAIEYSNIKSLDFEVNNAIGFHPVFDDADNGDRKLQMTWTGREAHDQSQGFGHIILSNETMPVSAKGKLPLTWSKIKK
jgi:hypothetical protein